MANGESGSDGGWMGDVQRALALAIIGLLVLVSFMLSARLVWSADTNSILDLTKIMLAALVNMGLIALGFFFGSSKSKQESDATTAAQFEKLLPPSAPVTPAPTNPAAPVPPWWSRLTDIEKNAITTAAVNDPRVAAFITASQVGAATPDDLAYLVLKGLLTQVRADLIQTP